MIANKTKSFGLVFIQLLCIGVICVDYNRIIPQNEILLVLSLFGLSIAVWAILIMGGKNMTILPDKRENSSLVTKGPYKIIRHPMYTSLIITFIPIAIDYFTLYRLIALIALVLVFIYKSGYEEKLLIKEFPEYKEYMTKTFRLLPFIF